MMTMMVMGEEADDDDDNDKLWMIVMLKEEYVDDDACASTQVGNASDVVYASCPPVWSRTNRNERRDFLALIHRLNV